MSDQYYIDPGYKFDEPDARDYLFKVESVDNLPTKVDLRKYANGVENQRSLGSCVANASVSALEILMERMGKYKDLSRLFHYYNLRKDYSNLIGKDVGSYTRDAFKKALEYGICLETTYPYISLKVHDEPPANCYEEAKEYMVNSYARINGFSQSTVATDDAIDSMKAALASNLPIVIGMPVTSQLPMIRGPLATHNYKAMGQDDAYKSIGGHAMCVVGYDDDMEAFIVENSWGSTWGDNGYFAMSYDVARRDLSDVWVCTGFMNQNWDNLYVNPLDLPDETVKVVSHLPRIEVECVIPPEKETIGPYNFKWAKSWLASSGTTIEPNGNKCVVTLPKDKTFALITCTVTDSQMIPQFDTVSFSVRWDSSIAPPPPVEPEEPVVPPKPEEPVVPPKPEPVDPPKKKKSNIGIIVAVVGIIGAIAYHFINK